jgi:hypothetical protein
MSSTNLDNSDNNVIKIFFYIVILLEYQMNNIIKRKLLVFTATLITIGLFGISTVSMINEVLAAEKDKQIGMNTEEIIPLNSLKNSNEKCTWWDARGC